LAQADKFDATQLQAITSKFTITDEDREKERKEHEEEHDSQEKTRNEPIKLIKEKWRTNFDVSNKEDLRLFIEIVNNMSDDDIFRMQAMIYENIVRYDRKCDEKIWIYCHDPVFLGSLDEIKSNQSRENALMHAVPLRIDYGGNDTVDDNSNVKTVKIPNYMKELLEMDDIGFDSSIFRGNKQLGKKDPSTSKDVKQADFLDGSEDDQSEDSDHLNDDIDYFRENKEEDEEKQFEEKADDNSVSEDEQYQQLLGTFKNSNAPTSNVNEQSLYDTPDSDDDNAPTRVRTKSGHMISDNKTIDEDADDLFGPLSSDDDDDAKPKASSAAQASKSEDKDDEQDDEQDDNFDNVHIKKNSNTRKSFGGDGNSSVSEMEQLDSDAMRRNKLKNKRRGNQRYSGSDTSDNDTDASTFNGPRNPNGFMAGEAFIEEDEYEEDNKSRTSNPASKQGGLKSLNEDSAPLPLKNGQRIIVQDDDDDAVSGNEGSLPGRLPRSASGTRMMPGAHSDNDSHYKFNANFLDSDGNSATNDADRITSRPPLPASGAHAHKLKGRKDNQWADSTDDDMRNEVRGPASTNRSKKITVQLDEQSHHSDYSTEREIVILDDKDPGMSHHNSDKERRDPPGGKKKSNW
jgi:hypothetical protein